MKITPSFQPPPSSIWITKPLFLIANGKNPQSGIHLEHDQFAGCSKVKRVEEGVTTMKGAVFVALQEMIMDEFDLDLWHQIIDAVGSDGVYTATLNYDDGELMALLAEVCSRLSLSRADALRHFGYYLFDFLHRGHPTFADSKADFNSFIASIDGVIHMEVMKLDDQARPPKIEVHTRSDGETRLRYSSERNLCHLAEGLLRGAADHFGISIELEQRCCRLEGADVCEFRISTP